MVDLSQGHSSPYLSQGSVPDSQLYVEACSSGSCAAVTVLSAGDAALGSKQPLSCGSLCWAAGGTWKSGRGPCRPVVALGVDGTTCPRGAGAGDSGQEESARKDAQVRRTRCIPDGLRGEK